MTKHQELIEAIIKGDTEQVVAMIADGIDVKANHSAALIYAAEVKDAKIVDILLKNFGNMELKKVLNRKEVQNGSRAAVRAVVRTELALRKSRATIREMRDTGGEIEP